MNAVVWAFLAGAVVGILMFMMASEWIPRCIQHWRDHDRVVNADIAFLRAVPSKDEGLDNE